MADTDDGRGILYPARLPSFHREAAPAELRELVRWFWIPRWNLPAGEVSRQELLPFPASNLVVEPDGVQLDGPTTGASRRDLKGNGWAVGALLRPAALAALHPDPGAIRDSGVPIPARELHHAVREAMLEEDEEAGRSHAVEAFVRWGVERLAPPDANGALANAMEELIASDPIIVRVDQVARRLGISTRSVQRLAQRYIGLPPLTVIRRYRLQEAARRLRDNPSTAITALAAELGYSDHAHLGNDFRTILGLTPGAYRGGFRPGG